MDCIETHTALVGASSVTFALGSMVVLNTVLPLMSADSVERSGLAASAAARVACPCACPVTGQATDFASHEREVRCVLVFSTRGHRRAVMLSPVRSDLPTSASRMISTDNIDV